MYMLSLCEAFGVSENFLAFLALQKHSGTQQNPGHKHYSFSAAILSLTLVIHRNN